MEELEKIDFVLVPEAHSLESLNGENYLWRVVEKAVRGPAESEYIKSLLGLENLIVENDIARREAHSYALILQEIRSGPLASRWQQDQESSASIFRKRNTLPPNKSLLRSRLVKLLNEVNVTSVNEQHENTNSHDKHQQRVLEYVSATTKDNIGSPAKLITRETGIDFKDSFLGECSVPARPISAVSSRSCTSRQCESTSDFRPGSASSQTSSVKHTEEVIATFAESGQLRFDSVHEIEGEIRSLFAEEHAATLAAIAHLQFLIEEALKGEAVEDEYADIEANTRDQHAYVESLMPSPTSLSKRHSLPSLPLEANTQRPNAEYHNQYRPQPPTQANNAAPLSRNYL